ncbi:hypothetical protein vseg_012035 [Gypsophila vaccaria]
MKRLWELIDELDPLPTCTCGSLDACTCLLLKRILERDSQSKLIHFLMRLNSSFDTIRTTILSMEPLPTFNKALALLHKVEKQKQITDAVDVLAEATAFASAQNYDPTTVPKKPRLDADIPSDKSLRQCTHCLHVGHLKEDCFKLKDCEYCGRRGHIKPHCYKLKNDTTTSRGRGRGRGRSNFSVYNPRRNAYTAEAFNYADGSLNSPLDDPPDYSPSVHKHSYSLDPQLMNGLVSTVVEQVCKVFSDKASSGHSSTSSFAGHFK